MYQLRDRQGPLDLVALQVSDQVPADGAVFQRGRFLPELLRPVLAEVFQAELRQKLRRLDGEAFGDANDRDVGARPSRAPARLADAALDLGHALGNDGLEEGAVQSHDLRHETAGPPLAYATALRGQPGRAANR